MKDLPSFVLRREESGMYSLKVNGKEIGGYVSGVSINVDGSDIMKVNIEIPASSFEAYCDFEIGTEKA